MRKLIAIFLTLLLVCPTSWAGIDFDNVDDSANCGNLLDAAGNANYSISACVRVNNTSNAVHETIISKYDSNEALSSKRHWFMSAFGQASAGTYKFFCWRESPPWSGVISASAYNTGEDHCVTCTYDGSNYRIYVDGVLSATTTSYTGSLTSSTYPTILGAQYDPLANYFGGYIYDAIVHADDLVAVEVENLHKGFVKRNGLQIQPTDLKLVAPLDDQPDGSSGDGDVFRDASGNANHCTGDDGANNTGFTAIAEKKSSYP